VVIEGQTAEETVGERFILTTLDEEESRLKLHKHYDEPFPNETLKSEFDVTEKIYRTTTTYGIQSIYKWVQGHQDKNTPYDDLDLEANLNVDAEKYAGGFELAKGNFQPLVSLLPSCDAMLSIRGISVTSNYRKQLIRAYIEPEYKQYLQYRFEWLNETIEMISWKCLSLAIQRINQDVLILQKYAMIYYQQLTPSAR
jgi:prenyltransferase beta subunit